MKKKFIASYSGGKDSVLALYRTILEGHEPIALITTYDKSKGKNWFHGLDGDIIESLSKSLGIPIWMVETNGHDYEQKFEEALIEGKIDGADFCVFGDIFIEEHFDWCSERCKNAGIEAVFPLFGEDTVNLVKEFVDEGFIANVAVVDLKKLDPSILGRVLNHDLLKEFDELDIDICGEFGEYHTFVSAGPIFKEPVKFLFGSKDFSAEGYAQIPIVKIK